MKELMNKNHTICAVFLLVLLFGAGVVGATPFQWSESVGGNGHWYDVVDASGSWDDFYNAADAAGGYLATVTSAEENTWLVGAFTASKLNLHIFGGTDATTEGSWEWVTGEAWSYTNWASWEPNNALNEDYLQFWDDNGTWNDIRFHNIPDSYLPGYVVEYDSNPVPEPATMALLGIGLLGLAGVSRRKFKK